jgi:predicted glycosyltransferase
MNILIDIGHPAHVHIFKHFALEMQSKGHKLLFTCREKEFEIELLEHYGFDYKSFGKKYTTTSGKVFGIIEFGIKEYIAGLKFKPDILLSHGSIYAALASFLLNKPHISFEDTFNFEQIRLYKPFTKVILTATYQQPDLGPKNIKYSGYHELAYLHPNHFKADISIKEELKIQSDEKYFILRFVSWEASHDIGHYGITFENKIKLVEQLANYGKIFISSEKPLPVALEKYQIQIPSHRMHDAIAFSSLLFGESATMASEAAVLGIPAVYLDNTGRLYTQELQDKYGLVFNYTESLEDQDLSIQKAIETILQKNFIEEWYIRRQKMLNDKIDVTSFLVWFVENWPASMKIMKENPDYQYNFR